MKGQMTMVCSIFCQLLKVEIASRHDKENILSSVTVVYNFG